MEDFTVPEIMPPASVMPTCRGQSIASDKRLISRHSQEGVRRLHRNLVFAKIQIVENPGVIERALDHRFGAWLAVFLEQVGLQRTGIDADAHRAAMILGRLHHFAHALGAADIAGIDAQAGRAVHRRLDGALVVKMDIGHDRNIRRGGNRLHRLGGVFVGAGNAHDIGARFLDAADLVDGGAGIAGDGVGHGLDRDRRVAAHGNLAHHDLARLAPVNVAISADAHCLSFSACP